MGHPDAGPVAAPIGAKGLGAAEMRRLGLALGAALGSGRTVALSGDLGTGKTFLIQAICTGLGVEDPVTSPTFALVHRYAGRLPVHHIDLYRLGTPTQADEIGLEEIFDGEGVALVEWADRAPGRLPETRIDIVIAWAGPETRDITIAFRGRTSWDDLRRTVEGALGGRDET